MNRQPFRFYLCGVFCWLSLIAIGLGQLLSYSLVPGSNQLPYFDVWPGNCKLQRNPDRLTLLLFLHPKCGCSQATLRELEQVLASTTQTVDLAFVLYHPRDCPSHWSDTSITRQAAALASTPIYIDIDGVEATNFGVTTSGHLLLFEPSGRLIYSGGITAARGHEGSNLGSTTLAGSFSDPSGPLTRLPVFGCSLHPPSERQ